MPGEGLILLPNPGAGLLENIFEASVAPVEVLMCGEREVSVALAVMHLTVLFRLQILFVKPFYNINVDQMVLKVILLNLHLELRKSLSVANKEIYVETQI